jgi:hypothetical protein
MPPDLMCRDLEVPASDRIRVRTFYNLGFLGIIILFTGMVVTEKKIRYSNCFSQEKKNAKGVFLLIFIKKGRWIGCGKNQPEGRSC